MTVGRKYLIAFVALSVVSGGAVAFASQYSGASNFLGDSDHSASSTAGMELNAGDAQVDMQAGNVIAELKKAGSFGTLLQLLDAAGLTATFQGTAQYTLFAPTDAAFAALPAEKLSALKNDTALLKKVLQYHVVSSTIPSSQLLKLKTARTLQSERVEFAMKDGKMTVQGATVVEADIKASNGVIHGIDAVLMPK